jgi:hypothetical protein
LAKNTGEGWRRGQIRDRYQQFNERTDRYDKYDGDGNHDSSKSTGDLQGHRRAGSEEADAQLIIGARSPWLPIVEHATRRPDLRPTCGGMTHHYGSDAVLGGRPPS